MEVEIKIYENLDKIENFLIDRKCQLVKDEFQETYIYDNLEKSIFACTDGILRIRVTKDNVTGNIEKSATLKKLANIDKDIKSFNEHTIIIDDEKAMQSMFLEMGLTLKEYVLKDRKSYQYKNCLFEFDILKENGKTNSYLEVEASSKDDVQAVLDEINNDLNLSL
jgi:predicted adenylyl cyclase CyaB